MSAELNTELKIQGTDEELLSMIKVLQSFATDNFKQYKNNYDCAYLDNVTMDTDDDIIFLEDATDEAVKKIISESDNELDLEISGPYGIFEDLDEVGLFEKLADAAPNAYFYASVEGFLTGGDVSQKAVLKDGVLVLSSKMFDDDFGDEEPIFETNVAYNPITKEYSELDDETLCENLLLDEDEEEFYEEE